MRLGNLDLIQYRRNYLVGGDVICLCFVSQADAVAHYIMAYHANILRNHISATFEEGVSTTCLCHGYGGSRRCAEANKALEVGNARFGRLTGGEDDVYNVILNLLVEIDSAAESLQILYLADFISGFTGGRSAPMF